MGRHERVAGALVDGDLDVLAEPLEVGLERLGLLGREEVVVLGHVAAHDGLDLRQVGGRVVDAGEAVERDTGLDPVGALGGQHPGEHPAHAEPHHADAVARGRVVVGEEVDRAAHVTAGPVDGQALS